MNEEHPTRCTLIYPTAALPTCLAVIWEAGCLDVAAHLKCPCLFLGSPKDRTVNWSSTVQVYERIAVGVPKALVALEPNEVDHQHVIGSRVQSPGYVEEVGAAIINFVGTYQDFAPTAASNKELAAEKANRKEAGHAKKKNK